MIPTLARGALFLGDAVAGAGGRGLVSGRPSCDGGSRNASGGAGGSNAGPASASATAASATSTSAASASTSSTPSLPNSSLYAIRTSSRFNFARPSFEVSSSSSSGRRASVEAAAAQQSGKKFVRRVSVFLMAQPHAVFFLLLERRGDSSLGEAPRRSRDLFASHSTSCNDDSEVSPRRSRGWNEDSTPQVTRSGGATRPSSDREPRLFSPDPLAATF